MITLIAQPAFVPSPGMIGVVFNAGTLRQAEFGTIPQAIAAANEWENEFRSQGLCVSIYPRCYGRKPNGFDTRSNEMRRSVVPENMSVF